jgi:hypothetical protein
MDHIYWQPDANMHDTEGHGRTEQDTRGGSTG